MIEISKFCFEFDFFLVDEVRGNKLDNMNKKLNYFEVMWFFKFILF